MSAQDVIFSARASHVRELKTEIARLRADNARLAAENAELRSHFDLALLAAEDLRTLPEGGRLVVVDGWNLVLGSGRAAASRGELEERARAHLAANPCDRVWIVYDGPKENSRTEGRLRVSYTGGGGSQRADRFICDFLRMARFSGLHLRIKVETNDKPLRKEVERILV